MTAKKWWVSSTKLMSDALENSEEIVQCYDCKEFVPAATYYVGEWCDMYDPSGCPDCIEAGRPALEILLAERDAWYAQLRKDEYKRRRQFFRDAQARH